jgi:hypothetical protein
MSHRRRHAWPSVEPHGAQRAQPVAIRGKSPTAEAAKMRSRAVTSPAASGRSSCPTASTVRAAPASELASSSCRPRSPEATVPRAIARSLSPPLQHTPAGQAGPSHDHARTGLVGAGLGRACPRRHRILTSGADEQDIALAQAWQPPALEPVRDARRGNGEEDTRRLVAAVLAMRAPLRLGLASFRLVSGRFGQQSRSCAHSRP